MAGHGTLGLSARQRNSLAVGLIASGAVAWTIYFAVKARRQASAAQQDLVAAQQASIAAQQRYDQARQDALAAQQRLQQVQQRQRLLQQQQSALLAGGP